MKTNQKIYVTIPDITDLVIDLSENNFNFGENNEVIRFLKMIFTNRESFETNFLNKIKNIEYFNTTKFYDEISLLYDTAIPYSFEEAFKIKDNQYRIAVFSSINIREMIEKLGAIRIATDGKTSMQKQYDKDGNYLRTIEMSNVYEIYEVSGEKLALNSNVYALKCWCTTTSNEHWLWIDEKYKNNPLEAIASTFIIHENIIPYIKELKRQGDILFAEMKEGSENIKPEGNIVSLTAEQYFGLLKAQS